MLLKLKLHFVRVNKSHNCEQASPCIETEALNQIKCALFVFKTSNVERKLLFHCMLEWKVYLLISKPVTVTFYKLVKRGVWLDAKGYRLPTAGSGPQNPRNKSFSSTALLKYWIIDRMILPRLNEVVERLNCALPIKMDILRWANCSFQMVLIGLVCRQLIQQQFR